MYSYFEYERNGVKCVKCISSYAGRKVVGIAKTDPRDVYDPEYGKALARQRCDAKIAEKRYKRSMACLINATDKALEANRYLAKMQRYAQDAYEAYTKIKM